MNLYGWIIYNGYLQGDKFRDFAEWIKYDAAKQKIETTIYKNSELLSLLSSDVLTLLSAKKIIWPDFVIFADKDIYLAKQLELLGVRVFNSAEAIAASDDKIVSYQLLAANKLPVPKTVVAPKAFHRLKYNPIDDYSEAIKMLGFPMIVKEAFGSFGEQVHLVHSKDELAEIIYQLQGHPFMLQEFIAESSGKDVRLQVVGDEVVAAMARSSESDFRANVTAGGKMHVYHPTTAEKQIAVAASKTLGTDFTGIDLLHDGHEKPIICEINSNAHIRNMFDCTGVDVGDFIIDYIRKTLK
ncbi:ATP-grasp domain-containing protein [Lentibacillus amyloliquefaciens]|uniref:RimK family alpha-L-glutamate ligase n=1 Tax=Lentibacillus amyloliquefaciens TaxID=1472767 RepID=A0A0U4FQU0_9BACI|nr:RimK family alpha-L-glutamate ligase [Lentibacillus amyloliquefaciens]ALX48213.1 RimK family alpha-L-glutamate ligase [Lentibacillus amyloliquefaciens]